MLWGHADTKILHYKVLVCIPANVLFCFFVMFLWVYRWHLSTTRGVLNSLWIQKLGFPAGVKHLVVVFINAAGREMELLIRLATVQ